MSDQNNQIIQNLLLTGAGLLIGSAIASVATQKSQKTKVDVDVKNVDDNLSILEEQQNLRDQIFIKKIHSNTNLPIEEQTSGLRKNRSKILLIPESSNQQNQIKKLKTLKKNKSSILNLVKEEEQIQNHSLNYQRVSKRQSLFQHELLSLAKPIIDRPLHLIDLIEFDFDNPPVLYESPLLGDNAYKGILGGSKFIPVDSFLPDDAFVIASKDFRTIKDIATSLKFLKAGAKKDIFFNVDEVKAAIVTCGGLCPGLNVVIREIVMSLYFNYEVQEIYGIKWGYKGFYTDVEKNWVRLLPRDVSDVHKLGGTFLGSSRGGFDGEKILEQLMKKGINQVYIIGGDGTHRGINALTQLAEEKGLAISFAGIPKTIDNDIPLIDASFGFATSCEVAAQMIQSAYIEATGVINGVGLIKLMGRHSGYIAMNASLAHASVDFCLIPENPFELNGPNGLYEQVYKRIKLQGHAVIVVAEGAEDGLINPGEKITKEVKKDGSGNIKLDDIGEYLKESIVKTMKQKYDFTINLKYIDPTYAIRSVAANGEDTIMCSKLAQNAVNGAMAGFTAFSSGVIKNAVSWIPIKTINEAGINKISIFDRAWQRLLGSMRQKSMVNKEFLEKSRQKILQDETEKTQRYENIKKRIQEEDHEREQAQKAAKF